MNSKSTLRLFLFAFFGWAFDFYDLVLLGFIKDDVARDLGMSHSAETWMLGVALSASGIGGIVAGFLSDRIGKRTMLFATILTYSIGSLVCGLAPSLTVFLIGRAIVGLGVGGEWAIGHGMVAEAVSARFRGRASAGLQAGEPVGVAMAAIVGYVIMPLPGVGWRWVLIGSSITALLAVVARTSAHLPSEVAHAPATWKQLRTANVGTKAARAWVLGVLKLGTYWTCYTWLPSFLLKEMHQDLKHSLSWMLTAQCGQLFGMLTFGWVSDKMGRRPAFALYSLITACGLAPLAFAWQTLSATPFLFWAAMLTLGIGSGCTAGFGALLAELFPTEVRGALMGTTYNLARAAQLFAPFVVDVAVSKYGLAGGLSVPLGLAIATSMWVWTLPETRGIILPTLAIEPPNTT